MKARTVESRHLFAYVPYVSMVIILAVVLLVRIRLLQVPLERDEGEFAYMGQLMLKGIPPYVNAYTMKLPGVCAVYALFMFLFGQTAAAIHFGLLIVNVICIWLIYLLAGQLLGRDGAVISCAAYAVLSLSQSVDGVFAHATHFVVLFSLAGLLLMFRYLHKGHIWALFAGGFCFGLAFIMKQHAVLLTGFAFLYLVWYSWKNPSLGKTKPVTACAVFLPAAMLPYVILLIYVSLTGGFDQFWFWTVQYAREYASEMDAAQGATNLVQSLGPIVELQLPFWLLALGGGIFLCFKRRGNYDRTFLFGFLFFSMLSVCPGLYFREHYFIMLMPAVALMAGAAALAADNLLASSRSQAAQKFATVFMLVTAAIYGFYHEKAYCFSYSPRDVSRAVYGKNPFIEAAPIARYIREHTSGKDRVAVLGSEPELLFYADRLSATRHIYMYGLIEDQPYAEAMQEEMIRDIETVKPKYVVMVNILSSWLVKPTSHSAIIDWRENYVKEHYERVGTIDILDFDTTNYMWDEKARGYSPASESFLTVFKRKEAY